MKRYVSDTQLLIWYFTDDERRLPKAARAVQMAGDDRASLVPSIALVEAVFLRNAACARAILAS